MKLKFWCNTCRNFTTHQIEQQDMEWYNPFINLFCTVCGFPKPVHKQELLPEEMNPCKKPT